MLPPRIVLLPPVAAQMAVPLAMLLPENPVPMRISLIVAVVAVDVGGLGKTTLCVSTMGLVEGRRELLRYAHHKTPTKHSLDASGSSPAQCHPLAVAGVVPVPQPISVLTGAKKPRGGGPGTPQLTPSIQVWGYQGVGVPASVLVRLLGSEVSFSRAGAPLDQCPAIKLRQDNRMFPTDLPLTYRKEPKQ
jgi:hypothetical protein